MRARVMETASLLPALATLLLGLALQWAFTTLAYASLTMLILGLAAPRLVALIAAFLDRQKGRT